ncbi:MAG TPA: AAA family ATPase [Conexibacter sp.]|nr:AAA family ATPase [Conexibacter sp.]
MRYTYFEFKNFKGIRSARIDLQDSASSARIFALVGLNESGKTTVLEGIDAFQGDVGDEVHPRQLGDTPALDRESLIPIAERSNFNGYVSIRCEVELSDDDFVAARTYLRNYSDGFRLTEVSRRIAITDRYNYEDSRFDTRTNLWNGLTGAGYTRSGTRRRKITSSTDHRRWLQLAKFIRSRLPAIWFFPNFLFDFPDRIYIEPHSDETDSNRFYRALFQDVLDALARDLTVKTHIVDRYRSGNARDTDNLRQVLLEASRHVTGTVVRSWNEIFLDKPMSQKRVVIDLGEDDVVKGRNGRLWVQFRVEDTDGLYSIHERSLGFRWFFVYLLLTTYRGQRKDTDVNMLYLFDEPASNLHPSAQRALLASFGKLASSAVIIYTTHSHHLIEPNWLGTTSVVANRGLGDSPVSADFSADRTDISVTPYRRFAARHPPQAHYFQPILDVLDYVPSSLEFASGAIFVEGKSDFYLLRYFEDMVLRRPAADRLHWMPGGGAGTLDSLIQLAVGWAYPFVALLDSDRAGSAQAKRYRDKFGAIVDPHLMLLSEASGQPNVRAIESVLSEEDRLGFQRLLDPDSRTYRKKTLALAIQEAVVGEHVVPLSDSATMALTTIDDRLRRRLVDIEISLRKQS